MIEYFDSHCHLDDERFNNDREDLIKKLKEAGVTKVVSAGYCVEGSKRSIELGKEYDFVYSTIGISPNDIENPDWDNIEADIAQIDKLLEENKDNPKVVAVGEIGLDYHYDTDKEIQKEYFIRQIELANKYNLPIVIHSRDAFIDTINILKEHPVNKKGQFHCCQFNEELVKEALKLDYMISFGGTVTFKNAKKAEEIIKMVPLEKILIETDAPYLAPEPVRGTRNDSSNLKYIVEKIAEFKGFTPEEVAQATYNNALNFFILK